MDKIKVSCSKNYQDKLSSIFEVVDSCSEDKTIILNNKHYCTFDSNLYLEQRILRCALSNNIQLSEVEKISIAKSLIKKTNRFLTDCDSSLFEDFQYLLDVNREDLYKEIHSLIDKPYKEHIFESEVLITVKENGHIAEVSTHDDLLKYHNKNIDDVITLVMNMHNIENINWWKIKHSFSDKKCHIYMISIYDTFDDFYGYVTETSRNNKVIKVDLNDSFSQKEGKCLKELEEYIKFD